MNNQKVQSDWKNSLVMVGG